VPLLLTMKVIGECLNRCSGTVVTQSKTVAAMVLSLCTLEAMICLLGDARVCTLLAFPLPPANSRSMRLTLYLTQILNLSQFAEPGPTMAG
jgi:hypothetical protein